MKCRKIKFIVARVAACVTGLVVCGSEWRVQADEIWSADWESADWGQPASADESVLSRTVPLTTRPSEGDDETADLGDSFRLSQSGPTAPLEPAAPSSTDFAATEAEGCWQGFCSDCKPAGSSWLTVDYLHWWLQGDQAPPLVTSSPNGTDRTEVGVLGLATTTTLFGDERIGDAGRPGVRIEWGRWLDACRETGVGVEFFWAGEDPERFSASSQGDPALARPFFNSDPNVNGEDAELVAFDDPLLGDILDGTVRVDTNSEAYSVAPNFHHLLASRLYTDRGYRVHLVGGYRFFRLNESLRIGESLLVTDAGGLVAQGTTFDIFDEFGTSNEFHGGEVGLRTLLYRGAWSVDALAKLGIGNNHQHVRVNGQNSVAVPGFGPVATTGGLLAQTTNIGSYENDEVALLPEMQLNLAWRWTPVTTLRVGYTLLYLTEAVRPGSHVDRSVDGRFLDPLAGPFVPAAPALGVDSTSVWLQGVNIGLERVW